MLNFLCFFVLCIAVKTDSKLTLHHMGIYLFIYLFTEKKIKIWRVTFFETFYATKKLWDGLMFSGNNTNIEMNFSLLS